MVNTKGNQMTKTYQLPKGYQINSNQEYYLDETIDETLIWQPQVYSLALEMMLRSGIKNLIDIGSGNGKKLKPFLDAGINVHVFDFGDNLKFIAEEYSSYENISLHECNLEFSIPELDDAITSDALIIASDVIEHIIEPHYFLQWLSAYSKKVSLMLISTPDRDKIRGYGSLNSPENKAHVREWNLNEFMCLMQEYSITNTLCGYTTVNNKFIDRSTLFVLSGSCVYDAKIDEIVTNLKIVIILYIKNDDIHNYVWHLKFWKQQNIELYFIIEECENQETLREKLIIDGYENRIIFGLDEILLQTNDWILESDFSSYLTSNFLKNPSLADAINFIDRLGYTEIYFREEENFNNYFTLTNRVKSVKKSHITKHRIYPILLKKNIFLNKAKPYMVMDSLQNRYLYFGDILSTDLIYFSEANQEMVITDLKGEIANKEIVITDLKGEIANKEIVITDLKGEIANKEIVITDLKGDLHVIIHSTSWKITKPLRAITKWGVVG
jgi:2-polyprenyl-3-methyl-5-hydroxy-6-metoxy-1,4-benzoquinol methylase